MTAMSKATPASPVKQATPAAVDNTVACKHAAQHSGSASQRL